MYHLFRSTHRWIGIIGALFLLVIAATGFLLATKDTFGWVKPKTHSGAEITGLHEVVSMDDAARAAFSLKIPEIRTYLDIERIDYRPEKNVFKVVSLKGYHEVQVCGRTGKVLNVAKRVDQIAEDIHDFSFFAEELHLYGLPFIAIILLALSISGITIFFVPVVRRWKFKRKQAKVE
jgi:uncharacterized iron-regulated membrane protein